MDGKRASCMGKAVSMEWLSWGVKPASAPASDALVSLDLGRPRPLLHPNPHPALEGVLNPSLHIQT